MKFSTCILSILGTIALFSPSFAAHTSATKSSHWLETLQKAKACQPTPSITFPARLRSANPLKQRLDSMVSYELDSLSHPSIPQMKMEFEYNAYGQQDHSMISLWLKQLSSWFPFVKSTIVYDSKGRVIRDSTLNWDMEKGEWYLDDFREYAFDSEGRQTLKSSRFYLIDSKSWEGDGRETYAYDAQGRLISTIRYHLVNDTVWYQTDKIERFYDSGNQLYKETFSWWNSGIKNWQLSTIDSFVYDDKNWKKQYFNFLLNGNPNHRTDYLKDEAGRDTLTLQYTWNTNNTWSISGQTRTSYTAAGQIIKDIHENWNEVTWFRESKTENTYDSNGFLSSTIQFEPDNSNGQPWKYDWMYVYKTDDKGNPLGYSYYNWDNEFSSWVGDDSSSYEYDYHFQPEEILYPSVMSVLAIKNMLTGGYSLYWDVTSKSWSKISWTSCFYTPMEVTNLTNRADKKTTWFFNATDRTLRFDGLRTSADLQLVDLSGRKVLSIQKFTSNQLSLGHLRKGLYLLRIVQDGVVRQGKVRVE